MDKKSLRKEIGGIRDQLTSVEREQYSTLIRNHLESLPEYQQAQTVSYFVSFRSEVDTIPLIQSALHMEKRVLLPITDLVNRKLIFSLLKDFENELSLSSYGILEPKPEFVRPISGEELELILVPGLVYDETGYRIGYGGGYYDRFLASLKTRPLLVGIAFDFQVLNHPVPHEEYDIPVDLIVTEKRVIDCRDHQKR